MNDMQHESNGENVSSPQSTVSGPQSGNGDGKSNVHPSSLRYDATSPAASDYGATGSPCSYAKPTEDRQSGSNAALTKALQPRKKRGRSAKSEVSERKPDEPDERVSTISLIRKVRDNATWIQLLPKQREQLDSWLFDENLGYAKTAARVQKEFGIKITMASVGRYYRRRARVRQAEELVDAQIAAEGLNGLGVDAGTLRAAVLKLVGKAALNLACEKPEETEQLASLSQILLEAEQNDLRRGRLELAERCFDYEKTVESLADLPKFRAYVQAIMDNPRLSHDQKVKRVQDIMFHWERSLRKKRELRNRELRNGK